jgi:hypothetical protein
VSLLKRRKPPAEPAAPAVVRRETAAEAVIEQSKIMVSSIRESLDRYEAAVKAELAEKAREEQK